MSRIPPDLSGLRDHVVILNVNDKVGRVVEELAADASRAPRDVVVLVQDRRLWDEHPAWHPRPDLECRVHVADGCPAEPADLAAVGLPRARAAVLLADPRQGELADARTTLVAVAVERGSPDVHTVMELAASVNRAHLRATEVDEVVCLGELTEQLIAQSCVTPGVGRVLAHLLSSDPETAQLFLLEVPPGLQGHTFRELARRAIERRAPLVLCGFVRDAAGPGHGPQPVAILNPRARSDPGKDTPLVAGDRLVVLAHRRPDLEEALGAEPREGR